MLNDKVTISVCICTSGRPVELKRCLESIAAGTQLPFEVVVSDDSTNEQTIKNIRSICNSYPWAHYVSGPRRGLCANRNHAIAAAKGTHLSLIDDDGCVGLEFVESAVMVIALEDEATIITGDVLENGRVNSPKNPTFRQSD